MQAAEEDSESARADLNNLRSEYESKAPTATSNRECTAITVSVDGKYRSKEATATSDTKTLRWAMETRFVC